jgi:hypothetical protein
VHHLLCPLFRRVTLIPHDMHQSWRPLLGDYTYSESYSTAYYNDEHSLLWLNFVF